METLIYLQNYCILRFWLSEQIILSGHTHYIISGHGQLSISFDAIRAVVYESCFMNKVYTSLDILDLYSVTKSKIFRSALKEV